jgi:hypothetical protein
MERIEWDEPLIELTWDAPAIPEPKEPLSQQVQRFLKRFFGVAFACWFLVMGVYAAIPKPEPDYGKTPPLTLEQRVEIAYQAYLKEQLK